MINIFQDVTTGFHRNFGGLYYFIIRSGRASKANSVSMVTGSWPAANTSQSITIKIVIKRIDERRLLGCYAV
jgi:hypothetical protein